MARSIYVIPIAGDGTDANPRQPKYRTTLTGFDWAMFDYGDEPFALVGVTDISPAADSELTGNSDVFELPANLDQTMGNVTTRNVVRSRLESVDVPGTWVQTSNTYRDVVRFIGSVCQFAQRFQGISGVPSNRWFASGRTLDSTIGDLPLQARQDLASTSDSFGFDRSTITLTTTLRDALQSQADQYVSHYAAGNPLFPLNLEGPL